jgi:sortase A
VAAGISPHQSFLTMLAKMNILVTTESLKPALLWAQRTLFAAAILMLGYCAFIVTDTSVFQHREKHNLERLLHEERSPALPASSLESHLPPLIGPDGLIGRMEIKRLGVSMVVVEGTGQPTLRRAAGHIAGTALPGRSGNVGIAGHRDTFFRPLQNIRRDDLITLTTLRGEYRYRVVSTTVVNPEEVSVLNPDGNEILTLVTCYPFYFVGSAPQRFIVRAERVTG